jgi:hypothetical protein
VALFAYWPPIEDSTNVKPVMLPPRCARLAREAAADRVRYGHEYDRDRVRLVEKCSLDDKGARQPISGRSDCLAKCRLPAESDGRPRSGCRRIGSSGSNRPIAACRFSGRLFC